MITLGEILSIDDTSNLCVVKLPTLEGAGNKNIVQLSATMMLPPGINAGYEVGDVVFVSFVDNTLGRPTVLGQLYRGPGRGTKIDGIGRTSDKSLGRAKTISCGDLDVNSAANIPNTTVFTDALIDYNTPAKLIGKTVNLETDVKTLQKQVATLQTKVGKLEDQVASMQNQLSSVQAALLALAGICAGGFAVSNAAASLACTTTLAGLGFTVAQEAFGVDASSAED